MRKIRLDKLLSMNGLTRSQARRAISAGRVWVDGSPATDGAALVDADACRATMDGTPLRTEKYTHILLHKPAGYLTATEDAGAPTVIELLSEELRHIGLGPVGRLDKDVTGVLLLTTDGQLAHRLISPRWEQEKLYRAWVEGAVQPEAIEKFAAGIPLKDFTCKAARLTILESGDTSLCEVVVTEGKFHQVKRMFAAVGHPVTRLMRLSTAGLTLDGLPEGQYRFLTPEERESLYKAVRLEEDHD